MSVAVIGAGISGLSVAYKLVTSGLDVCVYDREAVPARNASWIAGGMLAPYSEIEALPMPFVEAGLRAIDLWQKIAPQTLTQNGSLLIAHKEDRHMLDRFARHLPESDDWVWADAKTIEPQINHDFGQGIFIPQEGNIHPEKSMLFLIEAIKKNGGKFVQQKVQPEDLTGQYTHVINCRGYGVSVDPDLRGIKGEIVFLENREFVLRRPVRMMHPRYPLYIIPREEHVFAVGASVIENADEQDESVLLRSAMELLSAAYSLHSSFGEAKILDMRSAVRPAYLDHLPRIKIKDNGVIQCNGLFRHGYLFAPIIAECVAQFVQTKTLHADFDLFANLPEEKRHATL